MSDYVMITGVSSGIGLATAKELLAAGFAVIGTVRREADAERLRAELGAQFTPLLLDVSDAAALPAAVAQVQALVGTQGLRALVNNAGVASPVGPLMLQPVDELRAMFETNVFGLLALTQALLPLLGARRGAPRAGRIINMSSVSGILATPFTGSYAASKFALEAITDTLRRELTIYGIDVIAINPGPVRTPIWAKGRAQLDDRYARSDFGPAMERLAAMVDDNERNGAPVEKVSGAVLAAITAARPKTRYPLNPLWYLAKLLPDRTMDKVLAGKLGLKRVSGQ